MAIKHKFASAVVDAGVATEVGPSEWNDEHNHVAMEFLVANAGPSTIAFTNLAAAGLTEVPVPKGRTWADLTYAVEARLVCQQSVAASSGSFLRCQYSTDGGTNWFYLDNVSGPTIALSTSSNAIGKSSWVTLVAGAKADVLLRVVAGAGDGVADPSINQATLQVR